MSANPNLGISGQFLPAGYVQPNQSYYLQPTVPYHAAHVVAQAPVQYMAVQHVQDGDEQTLRDSLEQAQDQVRRAQEETRRAQEETRQAQAQAAEAQARAEVHVRQAQEETRQAYEAKDRALRDAEVLQAQAQALQAQAQAQVLQARQDAEVQVQALRGELAEARRAAQDQVQALRDAQAQAQAELAEARRAAQVQDQAHRGELEKAHRDAQDELERARQAKDQAAEAQARTSQSIQTQLTQAKEELTRAQEETRQAKDQARQEAETFRAQVRAAQGELAEALRAAQAELAEARRAQEQALRDARGELDEARRAAEARLAAQAEARLAAETEAKNLQAQLTNVNQQVAHVVKDLKHLQQEAIDFQTQAESEISSAKQTRQAAEAEAKALRGELEQARQDAEAEAQARRDAEDAHKVSRLFLSMKNAELSFSLSHKSLTCNELEQQNKFEQYFDAIVNYHKFWIDRVQRLIPEGFNEHDKLLSLLDENLFIFASSEKLPQIYLSELFSKFLQMVSDLREVDKKNMKIFFEKLFLNHENQIFFRNLFDQKALSSASSETSAPADEISQFPVSIAKEWCTNKLESYNLEFYDDHFNYALIQYHYWDSSGVIKESFIFFYINQALLNGLNLIICDEKDEETVKNKEFFLGTVLHYIKLYRVFNIEQDNHCPDDAYYQFASICKELYPKIHEILSDSYNLGEEHVEILNFMGQFSGKEKSYQEEHSEVPSTVSSPRGGGGNRRLDQVSEGRLCS